MEELQADPAKTDCPSHKPTTMKLGIWVFLFTLTVGWLSATPSVTAADPKVLHLLNRLSFGPRPGDIEQVEKMGAERYIKAQLHPDTLPESSHLRNQLAQLNPPNLTPLELFGRVALPKSTNGQKPTPEQRRDYQAKLRQVLEQSIQARLVQSTESNRQLQEVMVDFWYNHFNVFANKGIDRLLVGSYEQQAIRPRVLGRFRDLLASTAQHPAMLFYLDNWQNTAPNSAGLRGKQGLNENYARELMELHTLGVEGGYTQKDVVALAKIFTGWTFRRVERPGVDRNGFYFDAQRHDKSDKVFLGHIIKGSGRAEGEQALDILAKSPATAHHVSYKLAQYFVTDQPPKALVDRLAQKFLATDGSIRDVLELLFASPEFNNPKYYSAKFKTPYQYVISAVRATGIEVSNVRPLYGTLQQLGMPLYGCLTPDGYQNTQAAWLNSDAMTRRLSFATALGSGRLPLMGPPTRLTLRKQQANPFAEAATPALVASTSTNAISKSAASPEYTVDAVHLATTLGQPFSVKTQQAIAASPLALRSALMLGSPEFMQR